MDAVNKLSGVRPRSRLQFRMSCAAQTSMDERASSVIPAGRPVIVTFHLGDAGRLITEGVPIGAIEALPAVCSEPKAPASLKEFMDSAFVFRRDGGGSDQDSSLVWVAEPLAKDMGARLD